MSQNKLTSSPSLHRPLLDDYRTGSNEISTFCAYVYLCSNGIKLISIMSSPNGQEAVCGVYPNSDRFKVKFSSLGDCYYERTVNIATFWPECYLWTSTIDTLKLALHSLYILST